MDLFFNFFFILGVLLCIAYIIVLFRNNKNLDLHHKILISIFGVFIFVLLNSYAGVNSIGPLIYFTLYVTLGAKVIIPVLLFFYIKSLFYCDNEILHGHRYLLIFPILYFTLYILPFILVRIVDDLIYLLGAYELYSTFSPIIVVLYKSLIESLRIFLNIIALLYLLIDLKYFYKLRKVIQSNYSQISNNNFIWVRFLIVFLLVILGIDFIMFGLQFFFGSTKWESTEMFTALALAVSMLVMGYYGLKQTKIFIPYFLLETEDNTINKNLLKQEDKDTLSQSDFEDLKQELIDFFETERPYLDTNLTLGKLAFKIGVTDKKMSALLNKYLEISFYEFVNNYRVKAFKKAIEENKHNDFTIEAISNECGFKSRASFYRIFKLNTSMSPSEYINSFEK